MGTDNRRLTRRGFFERGVSRWLGPALVLASAAAAYAQVPAKPEPFVPESIIATTPVVCPLSPSQTIESIAAFAKVAAAFTQEDRCGNCHGGVDPFSDTDHHAGGAQDPDGRKREDCKTCHSGLPGWDIPISAMFFMDGYHKPRKAATICGQMKRAFRTAQPFVNHIKENKEVVDFNGTAFKGTRGLNDAGQVLAFTQPYRPEPPSISQSEMGRRAQAWVDAMGGKFKGDLRCGCEPLHFAVQVYYISKFEYGGIAQVATMGPVNIPITFHDDGSYEGTGVLPFATAGVVPHGRGVCVDQGGGGMPIRVSGNAVEELDPSQHNMHIELTNTAAESGATGVHCNVPFFGTYSPNGGNKAAFAFDVPGKIADAAATRVPLPGPIKAILRVEVIDLSPQPVTTP